MERTKFDEWFKLSSYGLLGQGIEYQLFRTAWDAATEQAGLTARAACEVYGTEFAEAVYRKVMEGNQ